MPTNKRKSTIKKHAAIVDYFTKLWDVERKRYDDSLKLTASRYFCSISTVEKVLREANKA